MDSGRLHNLGHCPEDLGDDIDPISMFNRPFNVFEQNGCLKMLMHYHGDGGLGGRKGHRREAGCTAVTYVPQTKR